MHKFAPAIVAAVALLAGPVVWAQSPYAEFTRGPSTDPNYFPIGVWLQQPVFASEYQSIGVNLYVGLFNGPTEQDLSQLAAAGMKVICDQNSVGLAHINDPTIVGWLLPDEPDNAQPDGSGGYGPPVTPAQIQTIYNQVRANDPSRPALLNLGHGVAWDGWYGRGVRTNHPEDYPQYLLGSDIGSFDFYPMNADAAVRGEIWRVGWGTSRMREWSAPGNASWTFIEVSDFSSNGSPGPTASQIKSEVWQALVNGAHGIEYFTHQFDPTFNDRVMLTDTTIRNAVAAINSRIASSAQALNSPNISGATTLSSAQGIQFMEKRVGDDIYIFAVGSTNTATNATITNLSLPPNTTAEVLDEGRSVTITNGQFTDSFAGYGVHLYKITQTRSLWNVNNNGNWSAAANWSNGVPNGQSKRATLGSAITTPRTTILDSAVTLGSLRFQGSSTHTLSGTQTLTMRDDFAPAAQLDVTGGAKGVIETPLRLESNTNASVASGGNLELRGDTTAAAGVSLTKSGLGVLASKNFRLPSLDVQQGVAKVINNGTTTGTSKLNALSITGTTDAWSAAVDLTDNDLVIDYSGGSPLNTVRNQIKTGYNGGGWNGNGIRTSAGQALGYADNTVTGLASFSGQAVDATSVLIKYTYAGDANLDGQVDITDLGKLASAWQTSSVWTSGDFNYSGFVDITDLGMLASNWQMGVGNPLGPGINEALASVGLPESSVPEPALVATSVLLAMLVKRRVRR